VNDDIPYGSSDASNIPAKRNWLVRSMSDDFGKPIIEAFQCFIAFPNQLKEIGDDKRHCPKMPIITQRIQQIARINRHVNRSVFVSPHCSARHIAQIKPSKRSTKPSSTLKVSSTAFGVDMSTPAARSTLMG